MSVTPQSRGVRVRHKNDTRTGKLGPKKVNLVSINTDPIQKKTALTPEQQDSSKASTYKKYTVKYTMYLYG